MTRILQLEDDPMQVEMYSRWFELEFPDVEWDFAIEPPGIAAYADYDAVIIDFRMGRENGGDIAMQLAAAYPDKPTAIVSGNPPEFIRRDFPAIPPQHVLDKSGIETFTAALRELLQNWGVLPAQKK